jgi:hypothetical protein
MSAIEKKFQKLKDPAYVGQSGRFRAMPQLVFLRTGFYGK